MKGILIAAILVSQAMSTPAVAADLEPEARMSPRQAGAFAGARLRIPFGGGEAGKVLGSLALAPTLHSRRSDGSVRTRLGQGVELGTSGGEKLQVALGGRAVSQIAGGGRVPDGPKAGISPIGWVAIGAAVAAIAYAAWFVHEMNDCDPHDDEC